MTDHRYQTPQFQETDKSRQAREKQDLSPDLQHFLTLAKARYASSGTLAARQLASVVLNNVPALDEQALAGLCELIGRTKYQPQATRELLEG